VKRIVHTTLRRHRSCRGVRSRIRTKGTECTRDDFIEQHWFSKTKRWGNEVLESNGRWLHRRHYSIDHLTGWPRILTSEPSYPNSERIWRWLTASSSQTAVHWRDQSGGSGSKGFLAPIRSLGQHQGQSVPSIVEELTNASNSPDCRRFKCKAQSRERRSLGASANFAHRENGVDGFLSSRDHCGVV